MDDDRVRRNMLLQRSIPMCIARVGILCHQLPKGLDALEWICDREVKNHDDQMILDDNRIIRVVELRIVADDVVRRRALRLLASDKQVAG